MKLISIYNEITLNYLNQMLYSLFNIMKQKDVFNRFIRSEHKIIRSLGENDKTDDDQNFYHFIYFICKLLILILFISEYKCLQ